HWVVPLLIVRVIHGLYDWGVLSGLFPPWWPLLGSRPDDEETAPHAAAQTSNDTWKQTLAQGVALLQAMIAEATAEIEKIERRPKKPSEERSSMAEKNRHYMLRRRFYK